MHWTIRDSYSTIRLSGTIFNSLGRISESCERLVERCCCEIADMTGGRFKQIKVSLWAIPNATMVERLLDADEYLVLKKRYLK